MEFLCRLESSSSLGSGHWGHINAVVEDILNFRINTPFNNSIERAENWNLKKNTTPRVKSFTKRVTWFKKIYNKKVEFRSILTLKECKVWRHIDKVRSVALKKMDPCYSSRGFNSQQFASCEPSIGSFLGRNKFLSTLAGHLHAW
jgi:hypothetical protein